MLMTLLIPIIVCFFLLMVQSAAAQLWEAEEISLTPLESGYESLKKSNLLSSPFMLLAILFVLFDVELILLLPTLFSFNMLHMEIFIWFSLLMFLMITLLAEWFWSGLKWNTSYLGGLAQ